MCSATQSTSCFDGSGSTRSSRAPSSPPCGPQPACRRRPNKRKTARFVPEATKNTGKIRFDGVNLGKPTGGLASRRKSGEKKRQNTKKKCQITKGHTQHTKSRIRECS